VKLSKIQNLVAAPALCPVVVLLLDLRLFFCLREMLDLSKRSPNLDLREFQHQTA
jgi:hypothetical protein